MKNNFTLEEVNSKGRQTNKEWKELKKRVKNKAKRKKEYIGPFYAEVYPRDNSIYVIHV